MAASDVTVEQLVAQQADLAGQETRVEEMLPSTLAILRTKVPRLDDADPLIIAYVLSQAIVRRIRYESTGTGLYQAESDNGYSYTVNSRNVSSGTWWPADELELLGLTAAGKSKVGSIKLRVPYSIPADRVQW